jgi:hypothetical protein
LSASRSRPPAQLARQLSFFCPFRKPPSPHPILFIPGWADPPTIGEVIHGKKLTVADELRIGQENVEKVISRAFDCVCCVRVPA